jgi:hypothetical protein
VAFCQAQLNRTDSTPIVFTDESTITQDLKFGGLWRLKNEFVPDGIYEAVAHGIAVMVWGAIATNFRSDLMRCPETVNALSYGQLLRDAAIFPSLTQVFGERGFIWQQDNAPAHGPVLREIMKHYLWLKWPAHSPDLSPMEMIWSIIKRKLRGMRFNTIQELFDAAVAAWRGIGQDVIDNLLGSFRARCVVCLRHGGACLNGHWGEVHAEHHKNDPKRVPSTPDFVEE